jgi:hypothetical protein
MKTNINMRRWGPLRSGMKGMVGGILEDSAIPELKVLRKKY